MFSQCGFHHTHISLHLAHVLKKGYNFIALFTLVQHFPIALLFHF